MLEELRKRRDLVLAVTRYEHRFSGDVEQFKASAFLADGSLLHINEVWLEGRLSKYAYYWLTPTGELIQGWDNAPHHPEIETYPHHSHTNQGIQPSVLRSLADVLETIERQLLR